MRQIQDSPSGYLSENYNYMKLLKRTAFSLLGILLLILTIATILEKIYGTDFVNEYIYSSVPFVILWGVTAITSLLYIIKSKLHRQPVIFLLHLSLLFILAGAFTTWIYGEQGTMRVRQGEQQTSFTDSKGISHQLPFSITLNQFEIIYYKGTLAPMDFISHISVADKDCHRQIQGKVSMNHIFSYQHYRFYQSGYSEDNEGSVFSVSHDPYGIGITYAGYTLLLLSTVFFFFSPQSRFRQLLKSPLLHRSLTVILLLFAFSLNSNFLKANSTSPKVLPREVAEHFGDLYILYNNRICPLQTFARDFTVKLYGSSSYKGLTPEEVLTGWLFYYDSWKNEPIIRIKSNEARKLLEIEGNYARLKDYISTINEYKLEKMMNHIRSGEQVTDKRGIEEADEKFNIINLVCTGAMMKIFPCRNIAGKTLEWYSQSDQLPQDMDNDKWVFIRKSMSYVNEMIVMKKYNDACLLLEKIKKYQQKECDGLLPADNKFKAEKIYNQFDYSKSVAMACICIGLICFIYYCHCMASQKRTSRKAIIILNILLWIVFTYLSAAICLRGYVSNHLPLSNGFETMQFMAWCTLLLTFLLQRKFAMLLPFGFLLCGLTLMVSMLGESNPQITQLMPVLQSPLLSIHVVVIMIAYSLLAFIMLNGVTAVILHQSQKECKEQIERLQIISQIILYPAIFLLAIGIFIGAVWANVSWGRYWGWDPKEVWALITMLVYALALHPRSLPWFHRTMFFHVFCITAFITVLITYFGVNFLLGGMHSYANG
ncbi:cytochrome c biogenesis protein [Phocaeicola dorei]|jgi:cytochrome c-type biogenesis protein CcsB|uniref:Cytochrome c biogenesis protein n=5 Tax=Phocaeicola TaxID=909656 RepID=A0AA37KGS0_9BACT|nr:cytochrome c biogenesis protein [Phocaeicola dorei]GKH82340.1 cytochrome c biogenesis protein [Phocaeicola dorei]